MSVTIPTSFITSISNLDGTPRPNVSRAEVDWAMENGCMIWGGYTRGVSNLSFESLANDRKLVRGFDWVVVFDSVNLREFVARNISNNRVRHNTTSDANQAACLSEIERYVQSLDMHAAARTTTVRPTLPSPDYSQFQAAPRSRPMHFGRLLPSSSRVEEVHNELVPALAPRVQEPNVLSVEQLEAEILRRTQALVRAEMQQMALRTQSQSEGSNGNGTVAMVCKYGLIALAILVIGGLMFLSIVANVGIAYYQKNAVPPPAPQQQAPQQQAPQLDLVQALQTAFFAGQQSMFRPEQNAPTMQVQYHDRQGTQIHEQCKNGVCEAAVTPFKQAPAKKEFQSYVNKETPEEDDEGEPVVITKKSKADKKKAQQKSRVQQEEVDTDEKEVKTEPWTIGWNFSGLCWFLGFVIIVLVASQPVWVWLRRLLF